MTGTVLEASGLRRNIAGRDVVAGASLTLAAGEWVSLLGPSGSGKTTLLQLLGLLDRPTAGQVRIAGHDAWAWDGRRRARARLAEIGFVFQIHNLFDHLTVRENIALPSWKLGGSRTQALHRADRWIERFGLSAQAATPAGRLSLGEAQRAAIARSLINEPSLVLADEPTGSLDAANGARVLDALHQVCAAGAALLVVTHDQTIAARGRVIQMREGRIDGPG
jgi:putative ABC transport system ATP-binding protein